MTENKSLDIAGIGEAAKAVPPEAWKQAVDTACTAFREVLAPITALTSGAGRLIQAKFDRLVDAEKILAASAMQKAAEKIKKSNRKPSGKAKIRVIVASIDASAAETDKNIRELWSNLLAQEILGGNIHPEFVSSLLKLGSEDALLLIRIAEEEKDKSLLESIRQATTTKWRDFSFETVEEGKTRIGGRIVDKDLNAAITERDLSEAEKKCFGRASFTHLHLEKLELITEVFENDWYLTAFGREFIKAVSDPSAE